MFIKIFKIFIYLFYLLIHPKTANIIDKKKKNDSPQVFFVLFIYKVDKNFSVFLQTWWQFEVHWIFQQAHFLQKDRESLTFAMIPIVLLLLFFLFSVSSTHSTSIEWDCRGMYIYIIHIQRRAWIFQPHFSFLRICIWVLFVWTSKISSFSTSINIFKPNISYITIVFRIYLNPLNKIIKKTLFMCTNIRQALFKFPLIYFILNVYFEIYFYS